VGDGRTYAAFLTPAGLASYRRRAHPRGHKELVIPRRLDGALAGPTGLVTCAHQAGLAVEILARDPTAFSRIRLTS
jgi:glycerophosphoryl diester phosphodiesterase